MGDEGTERVSGSYKPVSEISPHWSTCRKVNPSSAIKSFVYFIAADMLLLLILLQDQHLLVHSNSARMSWFQTIITSLLSLFLSPVLIHSFIIWSMPGTLSLIKDAEIC